MRAVRLASIHNSAATLQSLTAWLHVHGQHVQEVILELDPPMDEQPCSTRELVGCLTACAATAAGSLQQLELTLGSSTDTLCVASWCAALRQLRSLCIDARYHGQLRIGSSLEGLTALTRLVLSGRTVSVDTGAQLPPAVERLRLWDETSAALPLQVGCRLLFC